MQMMWPRHIVLMWFLWTIYCYQGELLNILWYWYEESLASPIPGGLSDSKNWMKADHLDGCTFLRIRLFPSLALHWLSLWKKKHRPALASKLALVYAWPCPESSEFLPMDCCIVDEPAHLFFTIWNAKHLFLQVLTILSFAEFFILSIFIQGWHFFYRGGVSQDSNRFFMWHNSVMANENNTNLINSGWFLVQWHNWVWDGFK